MEAVSRGVDYIGGEHLLAALVAEPESFGGQALARVELELKEKYEPIVAKAKEKFGQNHPEYLALVDITNPCVRIAEKLAQLAPETKLHDRRLSVDAMPYTNRTLGALGLAGELARALGHEHVSSVHILLGLLAEGQGAAAQILKAAGVSFASVQEAALALQEGLKDLGNTR
jgi:ATP-dependent Clp protease ATP-binding subunit ClpC